MRYVTANQYKADRCLQMFYLNRQEPIDAPRRHLENCTQQQRLADL